MKRIGLISDTHGFLDDRFLTHLNKCDEIWHAGDIGSREVSDKLNEIKNIINIIFFALFIIKPPLLL